MGSVDVTDVRVAAVLVVGPGVTGAGAVVGPPVVRVELVEPVGPDGDTAVDPAGVDTREEDDCPVGFRPAVGDTAVDDSAVDDSAVADAAVADTAVGVTADGDGTTVGVAGVADEHPAVPTTTATTSVATHARTADERRPDISNTLP